MLVHFEPLVEPPVETFEDAPILSAPATLVDSAPLDDSALLDDFALRELLEEVGLPLFLNFVGRMSASALQHQARLAQAAQEGDHAGARVAAHSLIGLVGHFGLKSAAALARRIESAPEPARAAQLALEEMERTLSHSLELLPRRARDIAA